MAAGVLFATGLMAQLGGSFNGNFEITGQYYQPDSAINAKVIDEKASITGFGNIIYRNQDFSAGLRFETYLPAPIGYPAGAPWTGTGIGYRFARYSKQLLDITVGNFYEQFGSGLLLRTWEDRGLGVDYSLDGLRVKSIPVEGIELTGLVGKQRYKFDNGTVNGDGIVRGFNADFNLNPLLDSIISIPGNILIGGSFVSRYQESNSATYDYPENVSGAAARLRYIIGGFQFSGEMAFIGENPSAQNAAIVPIPDSLDPVVGLWLPGRGVNLNATYSRRGLGISVTASSLSNMAFQSQREAGSFDSWINYLPPSSVLQTYLLSQLYPYATQPNGEVSGRIDLFYNVERNSALGGKYGMKIDLSYTEIRRPEIELQNDLATSRNGAEILMFNPSDEVFYKDFNVKITRKLSRKFKGSLFYQNLVYNNTVIAGAYDYSGQSVKGKVYADIAVFEGTYQFNRKNTLRFEAQALFTDQHLQDWLAGVVEYTVSPHWYFTVIDQWNYGNEEGNTFHFPTAGLGYIRNSSRISLSYGRQRAGVFCVGGVCRVVPASNGLTLTLSSSF